MNPILTLLLTLCPLCLLWFTAGAGAEVRRFLYCSTPDVFDVKTRKKVASLKDEHGKPFASSKFIEVHMEDGKVVKISSEFGLGRVHAEKKD